MKLLKNIGPATLVTAAFIGPGTVTICTIAGTHFGYSLLWAMVFSIFATLGLQEMSARLGIVTGKGLAANITDTRNPTLKIFFITLIMSAIVIGNLAYEAGNISGGMLGLSLFTHNSQLKIGSLSINYLSLLVGTFAFALLYFGNYKSLEKLLIVSVIIMSLSFIFTAILTRPSLSLILKGIVNPSISSENLLTVVALIGTTVVPYNLFLHSSLVKQKWSSVSDLRNARIDTMVAVLIGGIISMSIIICAATTNNPEIKTATHLAMSLEPVFGSFSKYLIGFGLLAAGLSSAITAPLAAALVAKESFSWKGSTSWKFRATWMLILVTGTIFSSVGIKPFLIIQFAQLVNGILLPVAAGFLLWAVNNKSIMQEHRNSKALNIFGIIIFVITLFLGLKSIFKVLTII
ncbi:MAG: manganese transport protein [Cyclobacteriaceae bacterium]|jgi:manganese transport protein